ncbi:MAG: flavin reductase [Elusimicrobiota bacterium]
MKSIEYYEGFGDFCRALRGGGVFLVVEDPRGKPNPMTIGWGTLGAVWGEPVLTVLVRPSRHTFGLLEKARCFSVNVPIGKMPDELQFCGTRSGRDLDKIRECGMKVAPGSTKGVSILPGCDLFYECEIVHKTKVIKETLDPGIIDRYYQEGDYHTVYSGRILRAYRK